MPTKLSTFLIFEDINIHNLYNPHSNIKNIIDFTTRYFAIVLENIKLYYQSLIRMFNDLYNIHDGNLLMFFIGENALNTWIIDYILLDCLIVTDIYVKFIFRDYDPTALVNYQFVNYNTVYTKNRYNLL